MFKESFKYYKSKDPVPSFEHVMDFHCDDKFNPIKPVTLNPINFSNTFGLVDPSTWRAYEIVDQPGFIYIKNPFTSNGQRYWIQQALEEYTKKPNKLNLDLHSLVPCDHNWWDYAQQDKSVLKKLRWSTLGYHHNWDTKVYSEEVRNEFPANLSKLCDIFAKVLGFADFKAEAAIVNFYHLDSTLSGHTDHSEQYLDAPLFSFSFGNSAIFLLGGPTINEKPTAVFLHSGDVAIMSKASRLAYHAVPRIVKTQRQTWLDFLDVNDSEEFKLFQNYLDSSRINLNVRQVLAQGLTQLERE